MVYVIYLINVAVQLITILVIVKIFLSYFMDPYHPVRRFIDRIIDPLLRPLQRIIPPVGAFDFSPLVLIILVQLIGRIIINLLLAVFP